MLIGSKGNEMCIMSFIYIIVLDRIVSQPSVVPYASPNEPLPFYPKPLETTHLFTAAIVLPFPEV